MRIKSVNGTLLWLWVGAEALRDPSGKNVIGATLAAIDISERKALTEAMLKIAIAERLTGDN